MTQEERTRISRELIVEGAIREFSRHDYENASINRICAENGISKGRLFHHFKNKDEIFTAALAYCYDKLCEETLAFQPEQDQSLEKNFHMYFEHRQRHFLRRPYDALLIAAVMQRRDAFPGAQTAQIRERFAACNLSTLRSIFARSAQEEILGDPDIAIRAFHIASYFIHLHVGYPNWDPEKDMRPVTAHSLEVFDQVVHMLLYGILPRQGDLSLSLKSDLIDRSLARAVETQPKPAAEGSAQEDFT